MAPMDQRGAQRSVRLVVAPGHGWIVRRGSSVLYLPDPNDPSRERPLEDVADRFLAEGPNAELHDTRLARCILEWDDPDGPVRIDSTFDLLEQRVSGDDTRRSELPIILAGRSTVERRERDGHAILSDLDSGDVSSAGDLRDGSAPAGGFVLVLSRVAVTAPPPTERLEHQVAPADVTAEPEQFDELTDLDVTLAPIGPVTYPDDDTDRTFRRANDVRCPRGHANASTNTTCRVCGESLDSTASRSGPRASTALAGLRLPGGDVIPINRMLAIGRSPTAHGARLEVTPRLVVLDAPPSVSRTHVLVRLDDGVVTVTDCGSRGRTAVQTTGHDTPTALEPWVPRPVHIGDTIQLGGPTTLTVTDPAELRVPPAFEPTARPPDQNETT